MSVITLDDQKDNGLKASLAMYNCDIANEIDEPTAAASKATRDTEIDAYSDIASFRSYWSTNYGGTEWEYALGIIRYRISYTGKSGGDFSIDDVITTSGGWEGSITSIDGDVAIVTRMDNDATADYPSASETISTAGGVSAIISEVDVSL